MQGRWICTRTLHESAGVLRMIRPLPPHAPPPAHLPLWRQGRAGRPQAKTYPLGPRRASCVGSLQAVHQRRFACRWAAAVGQAGEQERRAIRCCCCKPHTCLLPQHCSLVQTYIRTYPCRHERHQQQLQRRAAIAQDVPAALTPMPRCNACGLDAAGAMLLLPAPLAGCHGARGVNTPWQRSLATAWWLSERQSPAAWGISTRRFLVRTHAGD